ncbi:MAG: multidrug effflux MFS transporter [Propionibacteriaceae bacterium]|nr:multidrug effflux MFS transporter [Propionibacteriaceae bacterium]
MTSPVTTDNRRPSRRPLTLGAALLAPLVIVSAMPPLGTAAYLPGLPIAAQDLGVTTAAAQLTLTVYIVGMAIGQLAIGPLSDRIGRRTPLLVSIVAFVVLAVAVAFSPTLTIMLVLRLLQGIAASAGMVLGRAIVADLAVGDQAARAMSTIMAAGLIVPALAPLLGAAVLSFADWRTIFVVLGGLGALVGVWVVFAVRETHPRFRADAPTEARGPRQVRRPHQPHLGRFILTTLVVALSFAAMYAYVSAAPFVFQQVHGFSATGYALTGFGLSIVMAVFGIAGSRMLGRVTRFGTITPDRAVVAGLILLMIGALLVLAAVLSGAPVGVLIAALTVAVAPVALVSGSATALAMESSPLPGGSASAVVGTTQALFGAATPPLVGILGPNALPMAVVLAIASALALGAAMAAAAARRG